MFLKCDNKLEKFKIINVYLKTFDKYTIIIYIIGNIDSIRQI